jgi:hypothetical protein
VADAARFRAACQAAEAEAQCVRNAGYYGTWEWFITREVAIDTALYMQKLR